MEKRPRRQIGLAWITAPWLDHCSPPFPPLLPPNTQRHFLSFQGLSPTCRHSSGRTSERSRHSETISLAFTFCLCSEGSSNERWQHGLARFTCHIQKFCCQLAAHPPSLARANAYYGLRCKNCRKKERKKKIRGCFGFNAGSEDRRQQHSSSVVCRGERTTSRDECGFDPWCR